MSLVDKFATVGGATMASRVLGFAREALIGAALGAGPVADAFYAAFRFPNLFRRLLAEGAFNTAFIPLFSKEVEGGGMEAARSFAEEILSVLVVTLLALSGLALVAMPFLVATIIAPSFADTPDKFELTVTMTRIMFAYLFCMSLVAMLSGILNSLRRYFLAAFVPVLLNIVLIAVLIITIQTGATEKTTGLALALGVFLSGFLQLGFLVWGVHRQGFHMRLRVPRMTPQVRRLLVLMGPALLTGGVTQFNLLVGQIIASAQDGAIALLNYADRINQLPLGVIGIAIGVVLLPELARALKANDVGQVASLQNRSLEFALGLTLPAAVGFMLIPGPIVSILYERGAFTAETTALTAMALAAFSAGLPAFVLIKVFQPAFFAREDMKTPFWYAFIAVILNIAGSLLLFDTYGHVAIAIATSFSAWVNLILLAATLWFRNLFSPSAATLRRVGLIVFASLVMGIAIWQTTSPMEPYHASAFFPVRLISLLTTVVAAAVIYFGIIVMTGVVNRKDLMRLLRRH